MDYAAARRDGLPIGSGKFQTAAIAASLSASRASDAGQAITRASRTGSVHRLLFAGTPSDKTVDPLA